jgi:hypothetical protein
MMGIINSYTHFQTKDIPIWSHLFFNTMTPTQKDPKIKVLMNALVVKQQKHIA